MSSNYYQILEIGEDASIEEIKRSYRRLARTYHPDVTTTPEAETKFKEINRAYDVLSDPLKRADYDNVLHPTEEAPKPPPGPGTEEAYAWQPQAVPREEQASAFSRITATMVVFLVVGAIVEFGLRYIFPESPLVSTSYFYIGLLLAVIFGLMWGVDNNFDMEAILGPSKTGRFYTFLRSIIYTLVPVYFLILIGSYFDYFFYGRVFILTPLLGILAAMVGATLGSSGDSPVRLGEKKGRSELFYTMLRGIEVGVLGAVMGVLLGFIFLRVGYQREVIYWGILFGFVLGMIAGSINPPNLSAYASYISASLKNVVIGLIVVGSLLFGIIFGVIFSDTLASVFNSIWQSLINLIGG
jgi:hypothetical protein